MQAMDARVAVMIATDHDGPTVLHPNEQNDIHQRWAVIAIHGLDST